MSLALACALTVLATAPDAAEIEPYEARVVVARAQVRSGPGDDFYPTESLAQGETVEVYREQSDGWLAIRPPQNSFSWVFGRHLKLRDGGLAEVDKEEVASRIGSRFGSKRNAVQVQLRKGEVIEILGEEQAGGETWYKIAPPAGEFRWIHATNVNRNGPVAAAAAEPIVVATSATDEATTAGNETTEPAAEEAVAATAEPKASPGDDWRAAPAGAVSPPNVTPPPLASSAGPPANAVAATSAEPPIASTQTTIDPGDQLPDALNRQLTDIELRLSRMVAEPPSRWNTERLERDTEELLAQAQTAAERTAVKGTIAKVDRFKAIGSRYQQFPTNLASSGQAPIIPVPESTADSPEEAGRFDAVGILRPVVSKRPGAPQFALVNERGQVISFVTPTPDVNLQPYLGHRVGVVGSRGFIPEFQRAHVTAGRVAPLNESVVR